MGVKSGKKCSVQQWSSDAIWVCECFFSHCDILSGLFYAVLCTVNSQCQPILTSPSISVTWGASVQTSENKTTILGINSWGIPENSPESVGSFASMCWMLPKNYYSIPTQAFPNQQCILGYYQLLQRARSLEMHSVYGRSELCTCIQHMVNRLVWLSILVLNIWNKFVVLSS